MLDAQGKPSIYLILESLRGHSAPCLEAVLLCVFAKGPVLHVCLDHSYPETYTSDLAFPRSYSSGFCSRLKKTVGAVFSVHGACASVWESLCPPCDNRPEHTAAYLLLAQLNKGAVRGASASEL